MTGHLLLQIVDGHVLQVNGLGAIDVGGIRENADGHARTGDMGQPGNGNERGSVAKEYRRRT